MLRLSDTQLADITAIAGTLPRWQRAAFLQTVANELQGKELGDGAVHLAAVRAARKVEAAEGRARHGSSAIDGTVPIAAAK
jgi:hypothetical protein